MGRNSFCMAPLLCYQKYAKFLAKILENPYIKQKLKNVIFV